MNDHGPTSLRILVPMRLTKLTIHRSVSVTNRVQGEALLSKGEWPMRLRTSIQVLLIACSLWASNLQAAPAGHSEVMNGATCIPYPPLGNPANDAWPYRHWLYATGNSAFCQINMTNDWNVNNLSYVLFSGTVPSGHISARICINDGISLTQTCGAFGTLTPSLSINWVTPPPIPSYSTGAYLEVLFPSGVISTLIQVIPVWN